jgi:hypothetical protein
MSTYCEANSYNARNIFTKDELASIKLFNTFIKNLRKKYDENGELPLGVESLINGVHLNMTYLVNYLEEPLDKE